MAAGDRIISANIRPGVFYLQEGSNFRTTEWGYDEGERRWLTHPNTPENQYPQRNQRDRIYQSMFIRDVSPRDHESGLIEIVATFKGLKVVTNGIAKERIRPNADAQMMAIGILSAGVSKTLLAQVPKDVCIREYVTTERPSLDGVGNNASGYFLPDSSTFSVTFIPDPDAAPPPMNYKTGWVLDGRGWEDVAGAVYYVQERYGYYNIIGS